MRWIGWVVAALCAVVLVASWQQHGKKIQAADAEIERSLDGLRAEASERVATNQAGLDERKISLEKLREKTTELQSQKDALEARKAELKTKIKGLADDSERLQETKDTMAGKRTENRGELQELQERISQADRKVSLWGKMIEMVTEPGEGK